MSASVLIHFQITVSTAHTWRSLSNSRTAGFKWLSARRAFLEQENQLDKLLRSSMRKLIQLLDHWLFTGTGTTET